MAKSKSSSKSPSETPTSPKSVTRCYSADVKSPLDINCPQVTYLNSTATTDAIYDGMKTKYVNLARDFGIYCQRMTELGLGDQLKQVLVMSDKQPLLDLLVLFEESAARHGAGASGGTPARMKGRKLYRDMLTPQSVKLKKKGSSSNSPANPITID